MSGSKVFKFSFWFVVLLAVGAFSIWFLRKPATAKLKDSSIGTVSRGDIVQRVTMVGTIKPVHALLVRAPYKGFVRKIFVKIGDRVKRGSALISIAQSADQPDSEIFPMRSTLDGLVTQVETSEGESVSDTNAEDSFLVRVDDVSQFKVICDTPEIDVVKLKIGQRAIIRATAIAQRQLKGSIQNFALSASVQERWNRGVVQYRVEVSVEDTGADFRSGMTASVDVITDERRDVLRIGHEFIQPEDGKYYASLTDGQKIEVKLGLQDESAFEIIDGLSEGQELKQVDFIAAAKRGRGKN